MSEYEKQATDLLEKIGVTFAVAYVGMDCPMFCEDARKGVDMNKLDVFPRHTHIHGRHYRCTLTRTATKKAIVFEFWNSYRDEEGNYIRRNGTDTFANNQLFQYGLTVRSNRFDISKKIKQESVSAYDLLAAIEKYEPEDFEEWATSMGYDSDSRRAEQIWHAVREEWRKVNGFFTAEEIEQLQEIQ